MFDGSTEVSLTTPLLPDFLHDCVTVKSAAKQRCFEAPLSCCALLFQKVYQNSGKSKPHGTVRLPLE